MAVDHESSSDSNVELDKRWTDECFSPGTPSRETFERLCVAGCDARLLLSFLTIAVLSARHSGTIYDVFGVPQAQLAKLPDELEQISRHIEAINPILAEYLRAKFIGNPHWPEEISLIAIYKSKFISALLIC
jgi:hypothetical protein